MVCVMTHQGTGTLYFNDKPIGAVTNFQLNIRKEKRMKRKHVIETLENEVLELKSSLEARNEQNFLQGRELERLEGVNDRLSDVNHELKHHYSNALALIGNLTSKIEIS